MCDRGWEAFFWYRVAIFEWAIGWVVVYIVSSDGYDAVEGGAVFGNGGFREKKDVRAMGGDKGDDVGA